MRRKPTTVIAFAVLAAALAGCSSSSDSTALAPTSSATPATHEGSESSQPLAVSGHKRRGQPADGSTAKSAGGSTNEGATPGAAAGSAAAAPPDSSSASAAVPLLVPGSYSYHLQGEATTALGAQQIDGDSTLQADQPNGHRQHTTQRDDQGSTEQVLVAASDGLRLAEMHLSQTGFDEDFRPDSPVLLMPADPHQGDRWHWKMRSTDGKYTLAASLEVTDLHSSARTTTGDRRRTITLSSVLTLTGNDVHLTIRQADDATRGGVIVHEHAVTDGTAYGTKFHSDVTRTLKNGPQ